MKLINNNCAIKICRSEERNESKRIDGRQTVGKVSDSMKFKRRTYNTSKTSVFSRLSGPVRSNNNEEDLKPRLPSRVIRELPSRQDIVRAQGADSESRARNRRMFGSLLGTLHKFCQEESRLKQKEEKKAQIEKKVEEQEQQVRASLRRERELLFLDRKKKQMEIQRLELKMSRLKDFEIWEAAITKLNNNIRTKAKPHLYFRPRVMTRKTEKLLEESQAALEKVIEKKRNALNQELIEIENSQKLDCEAEESIDNNDSCILEENDKRNSSIMDVDDIEENATTHKQHNLTVASEIKLPKGKPMPTTKHFVEQTFKLVKLLVEEDSKANIIKLSDTTAPLPTVVSSIVVVSHNNKSNVDSSNALQ